MQKTPWRPAFFIVPLLAVAFPALAADAPERTSSIADQEQVGLTIYNANLALVHDRRHIALTEGLNRIAWRDVSANLNAPTALLESASAPGSISVREQNFNFDLLQPSTLLQKYVGRYITVVHDKRVPGEPERERARILSTNGGIVLQYADRIETQVDGHIVFQSIPENLRDRPTLVLDMDSSTSQPQDLDLSYLTGGLAWHADYVGIVSANEGSLNLNGLVTLSNTSGTTYRNARLQLVAGSVNVPAPSPASLRTIGRVTTASTGSGFAQENFGEYHLYTLQRPTTVADNQTKQVALLSAHRIPIQKTYEVRGEPSYYRQQQPDLGERVHAATYVSFENKGGELGIPLPAGIVRIYERDQSGTTQFLGADSIDHTPRNEIVRLHVGDAFDVTATKKQTDFRIVDDARRWWQSSYEIVLGNAKDVAVEVLVVEPVPGDWEIISESAPHVKSSSGSASWTLRVPPGDRVTLTYTVRTRWR